MPAIMQGDYCNMGEIGKEFSIEIESMYFPFPLLFISIFETKQKNLDVSQTKSPYFKNTSKDDTSLSSPPMQNLVRWDFYPLSPSELKADLEWQIGIDFVTVNLFLGASSRKHTWTYIREGEWRIPALQSLASRQALEHHSSKRRCLACICVWAVSRIDLCKHTPTVYCAIINRTQFALLLNVTS